MAQDLEFSGKRILFIVENLPSPFDRRVWQEVNALKEKGAAISIICPVGKGYDKKFEVINGISIYRHRLPFEAKGAAGYLLEYATALFHEFRLTLKCHFSGGFDVIHACNPPDLIYLIAIPYRWMGKYFIFDHHDINPELYLAKFNRKDFFYKLMCFLERRTFRHAQVSIATNESYRKIAIGRGGMKPEDVFVVRSGPSLERLRHVPANETHKRGKRFLVGYVGVIGSQEGLHYLVEVAANMVYQLNRKDVHFACIGDGTELKHIMRYADKLHVNDYISFYGRVSEPDLLEIISTSDVCINTDEMNEMNDKSTMNKIMEYMALGKPIVQFELAEGRYSAQDASLYARPNDSADMTRLILELLDDPERRARMGEFGNNRVRNVLEWGYEKENLYRAYRRLFTK
jgi:glycosyltransferase involved in cell wall biosynthesis